ncbi:hypothetical protein M0811_09030 [Anaeramoeba ignava]|uniref:BTB domain-containing protein n=1 Tax=Anaeramoeba ignava TaxID=1746090 RepID=A0A9Q0LIG8_ANAIG|nr:hypothetical protein M0811_09030 [Anaeramoeba ignava]
MSKFKKINDIWTFEIKKYHIQQQKSSQIIKCKKFNFLEEESQVKQIASGEFSTIFLLENGKVIEYYKKANISEKLSIENIRKVSAGFKMIAFLTTEREVIMTREDENPIKDDPFRNISNLIEYPRDRIISDVVCGANSVYLLSENGNSYGIGSNYWHQLGYKPEDKTKKLEKSEKPIFMMSNVSKIYSGSYSHSVFLLTSNQKLFCCGDNQYGQLGLIKGKEEIKTLTQIENLPEGKILDIRMGHDHSVMLIEEKSDIRKIYSCGGRVYNRYQVKERKTEFTEIKTPLDPDENILEMRTAELVTLILTSNGKLIGFGRTNGLMQISGNINNYLTPIRIQLPKLSFDISNYHISCGDEVSFLYSSLFTSLHADLVELFQRQEFCDVLFDTIDNQQIGAHQLILKYRLKDYQNQLGKLRSIISLKTLKEANQIFPTIYSNKQITSINLESSIQELLNEESIIETIKRIYLNENENEKDFTIKREEKEYKFPKLILIMRSELYRGMFLAVTEDDSNEVTDYSELSTESFQILEYWIYSNQIKEGIKITKEIIEELKKAMDYFQLNELNPNLVSSAIDLYNKTHKGRIIKNIEENPKLNLNSNSNQNINQNLNQNQNPNQNQNQNQNPNQNQKKCEIF